MPIEDYCEYAHKKWNKFIECRSSLYCEYEIRYGNSKYCKIAINKDIQESNIEKLLETRK